jgi:hypothetical protein
MRNRERLITPGSAGRQLREQRLGGITERSLEREQEKLDRYDSVPPWTISAQLGPWFREDIGSSGAGTYAMRLMYLVTHSTSAATVGTTGTGVEVTVQGSPGRVVAGMLYSSVNVTAGTATLAVQIDNGTAQPLGDIVLSTATPRSIVSRLGWRRGIPFAAGQTVEPAIIADGSFAPTTADLVAYLVIAWEEPG